MSENAFSFIENNRIGVVAVEMIDGSPHAATVHFAHNTDPFVIIILTDRSYRKVESILNGQIARASFVIGTDEIQMKTFQLDGTVELSDDQKYKGIYFLKFPDKKKQYNTPDDVFMVFKPKWWRYTDYTSPEGKQIEVSK